MCFLRYVIVVLGLLACCPCTSLAQQQAKPLDAQRLPSADRSPSPARSSRTVELVKPDTYMLPDENGQLQPMLGWTFEDFVRLWKSREAIAPADEEPLFSLQRLECAGQLEEDQLARMQAQIRIRLQSDRRISIPLGFPNAILTDYEASGSDGLAYLSYDDKLGEHVLWIRKAGPQVVEVKLEFLLPLARRGDRTVLKLHPPRAVTSRLTLTVPGEVVAETAAPPMHVTSTSRQNVTTIEALGLTETSEIIWRSSGEAGGDLRSLVAESQIHTTVEQGLLQSNVSLTVQDLQSSLRDFRIQLPPGAKLVSEELEGATLHQVEMGAAMDRSVDKPAQPDAHGAIYEIRLTEPRQVPFHVKIALERPVTLGENESTLLLEGVRVVGAVRQEGSLHLAVAEDLRVRWQEGHQTRQVAPQNEPDGAPDSVVAFAFDAADWRLPVLVALRPTEIAVEPEYMLDIRRDGMRLTATFRYSVRGTKRIDLRYALGSWELADDPQGPATTISGGNAYVDDAGTMYLPLTSPAEGSFETTLHLKMERSTSAGLLEVRLPECLDGQVQDGELHVTADRSLEVIPQTQALLGLRPQRRLMPVAGPPEPDDQSTQNFHVVSLPAEYVANVRARTRVIVNETRATVGVYADRIEIEQDMHLEIRHLPANEVALQIPSVISRQSLAFEIEGQSVAPVWDEPEAPDAELYIGRLVLGQPRLGGLSVRTQFQVPLTAPAGDDLAQQLAVPLVVPEADAYHCIASLTNYTNQLQVQFRGPGETSRDAASLSHPVVNPGDWSRVDLTGPVQRLPLTVRPASTTFQRTLMVDRTWLQSWIVGATVQTRTVMRLTPTSGDIVVALGAGNAANLHSVKVNDRTVSPVSDQELILSPDDFEPDAPCVIEIVQQAPFALSSEGTLRIVPPRIADARYGSVFWQLMLPQSLHGFNRVDEFISASPWRNAGVYWARVPAMSQSELEDFVGVPHDPAPAGSANQLLLRGFELPRVLEVSVIRRSTLVLVASGIILAAGVIILYLKFLHRFEFAAAAVILVVIGGTLYPDAVPMIAQAGILGLVLILVAVFLKKLADQWQTAAVEGGPADTSIFRRESSSARAKGASPSSAEATSSARTVVPSLSEPGVTHSA